ncbi:MAG: CRISPR-associated helicase Cas3' [Candidatus Brocadiae bacterium]|nr:CRISPR-associated helicase Cas3' [Candidatus Brocadiia bacterium]
MNREEYYQEIVGFHPNPLQKAVWEHYYASQGKPAFLIKAGTGTGKTEAVALPALFDKNPKQRRIIMILPSKALLEDMLERFRKIGNNLSNQNIRNISITMDMGGCCKRFLYRNSKEIESHYYRHLFSDDVILTTLDKFLFRFFGYGEKIKSYIFPHRVFGSSLGKKPFIIFDEAHEYEGLAFSNFIKLLEALYIKGIDLCVMSATLPKQFIEFLPTIDATQGTLLEELSYFQKQRANVFSFEKKIRLISYDDEVVSQEKTLSTIVQEIKESYHPGKRIIARMEYVKDVIALYKQIKETLPDCNPLVYHGRLTMKQRSNVIQKIISSQKENKGFLALATSSIEAGCDLDAHKIITELCNPDSLVQLAGRLNRKGTMDNAELVVVGNRIKPDISFLTEEKTKDYLETLEKMQGFFSPERLQKYFPTPSGDWMGEIVFQMLWDYVYGGDLTCKPLWDKGILVTRSWEPSITLCTGIDLFQRPINPVEIAISRFSKSIFPREEQEDYISWLKEQKVSQHLSVEDNGEWHAKIYRSYYVSPKRGEESHYKIYPLEGKKVSLYETNLVCEIQPQFIAQYFDDELGYVKIPKLFRNGYKEGFRQYLEYQPNIKNGCFVTKEKSIDYTARIWYLECQK